MISIWSIWHFNLWLEILEIGMYLSENCAPMFLNAVRSYLFRNRVNKKPNDEDWTFVLSAIRDPKCFDAVMIFKIELQLYSGRIWSKWNLLMENDHNTL